SADLQSAPFGHFGTYPDLVSSSALSSGFEVMDFSPCHPMPGAGGKVYRARESGAQV
ncbi:MAG: hypothetical protein QOH78_2573, partial [Verrucomicrobiota bacterium]